MFHCFDFDSDVFFLFRNSFCFVFRFSDRGAPARQRCVLIQILPVDLCKRHEKQQKFRPGTCDWTLKATFGANQRPFANSRRQFKSFNATPRMTKKVCQECRSNPAVTTAVINDELVSLCVAVSRSNSIVTTCSLLTRWQRRSVRRESVTKMKSRQHCSRVYVLCGLLGFRSVRTDLADFFLFSSSKFEKKKKKKNGYVFIPVAGE